MTRFFQKLTLFLTFFCALLTFSNLSNAKTLDHTSSPFLEKNQFLLTSELRYFELEEVGQHGSSSFGLFHSQPRYYQLYQHLLFAPTDNLELGFGYLETIPARFKKVTLNPGDSLYSIQRYEIDNFRDLEGDMRYRKENYELYFDGLFRKHRSNSQFSLGVSDPIVSNYVWYHYEKMKAGLRFISNHESEQNVPTQLETFGYSTLESQQWYLDLNMIYQYGNMKKNTPFTSGRFDHYRQKLQRHWTPEILIRYGAADNLDLLTGFNITSPFEYKYNYWRYNTNGSYVHTGGDFFLSENITIPFEVNYQPNDQFHARIKSPMKWVRQSLHDFQDNNGTVTSNPSRKLNALNFQPSLELVYLSESKKEEPHENSWNHLGPMLDKNQFLINLKILKDLTYLDKEAGNGALNLIDPYNAFEHPTEYYVAGTEHAAFLTGNSTSLAADVEQKNYLQFEANGRYGLCDNVDFGMGVGYHSGSKLHHYVLNEMQSRHYTFKPYIFLDFGIWWQLNDSISFSTEAHLVPNYTTYLKRSGDSGRFKVTNRYYSIDGKLRFLF